MLIPSFSARPYMTESIPSSELLPPSDSAPTKSHLRKPVYHRIQVIGPFPPPNSGL